jgi:MraZ protein
MSRFLGEFNYSLDEKGRLNIPAKFRKALSPEANETFTICRAPNNCLRAYPQDTWDRYEDELASRPQTPETLRHSRLLRSTLTNSKLDSQGRIALTAKQCAIANIEKNITLVGHYGYIEIWNTDRYNEYIGEGDDFDQVFFQSVEAGIRQ